MWQPARVQTATRTTTLLATDLVAEHVRVPAVCRGDRPGRGAVAVTVQGGGARRAEPGPAGPLTLEVRSERAGTRLEVWGCVETPPDEVERALRKARGWAGLEDRPDELHEAVASSPVLRRLAAAAGAVRLSRTPRLGEALGRSIIEQLVQGVEAHRSIRQLAAVAGTPAGGLWTWPTAQQLGSVDAWALRRCGISMRNAKSLHAACIDDDRLRRAADKAQETADFEALDARLRALPGVGPWTSAETRLRLGDPDAVSVGDYNLPDVVGTALGGMQGDGADGAWTDAGMLQLLEPYRGQRGRVIKLVEWASHRGLVARRPRRAPRAALSAHRYW